MVSRKNQSTPTEKLLEEVKIRLENDAINKRNMMAQMEEKKLSVSSFQKFLNERHNKLKRDECPNKSSILMTTIHCVVIHSFYCHSHKSQLVNVWPCRLNYESEVLKYRFHEKYPLEVSVIPEKTIGSSENFFYCLLSFRGNIEAYHIFRLSETLVPELGLSNQMKNILKLKAIFNAVGKAFQKFCHKYLKSQMENKKFRRTDFSSCGLIPILKKKESIPEASTSKKRKLDDLSDTSDDEYDDRPQYELSPVLTDLCRILQNNKNVKLSDSAKLFGTLHKLLTTCFGCQTTLSKTEWPGGYNYRNVAHQITYPVAVKSSGEHDVKPALRNVFYVSVLSNENDFFFQIRPVMGNDYCIQKVIKDLIPGFVDEEKLMDISKIRRLIAFLSYIDSKYMKKFTSRMYISSSSSANLSQSLSEAKSRDGDSGDEYIETTDPIIEETAPVAEDDIATTELEDDIATTELGSDTVPVQARV